MSVHVIYTANLYSSILILAFINLDRYLAIVRATDSRATRKLLASRVIYFGAWLPGRTGLFAEDGVESVSSSVICQRIYPAESALTWTTVFRFQNILVDFVLPGLVILICYCIIISSLF
ncbi:hypothetical protein CRENBAI_017560 [Crenichthys baileyi]|uniref:G-protein coupled receptors family 1 profile domain-containing protein n=1 Tax=Crenichthys baileyi TaxID=28760 RepID=A0AAV9SP50_9TELE